MTYSVAEAKTHLSRLLDLVEKGEEVVILRHGEPVARLVTAHPKGKVVLGAMRGEIRWKEGWEKPLTDEEADLFLQGRG
ncbi:MAG: type II toxin-antitoxin system prevent-host-death family antitoxin [Bryobacterales bacterium]|nr:type II toxin-antitoxin system prevent-host-death family antitoxin [Bryobacterales bacterium]